MEKVSPTAGAVCNGCLVYEQQGQNMVVLVDTPSWYAWLETATTFTFTCEQGTFTAHKARAGNRRGGWYWRAYRRKRGRLSRCYLGVSPISRSRNCGRRPAVWQQMLKDRKPASRRGHAAFCARSLRISRAHVDRDPPEQHYSPTPARAACGAPLPARAPGAGPARTGDAGLGSCWLWQDDAAGRMGCHERETDGLAFLRGGRERPGALPFLAHRCSGARRCAPGHHCSRPSGPGIPPSMNGF